MIISYKKILSCTVAFAAAAMMTACQNNENGTVDLSGYVDPGEPEVVTYNYPHPTALYTASEFQRVRESLANGTAPQVVKDAFAALKNSPYTNGTYGNEIHAHQQIVRGDPKGTIEGVENYGDAMRDAAAAYQFGLLWQITGDTQYAQKGINILNGWVKVCKEVTSNDSNNMLSAGAQGFTFALAGEQLRDFAGWTEDDFKAYKQWMLTVFAVKNLDFMNYHNRTNCGAQHYWSNWDLVNLCSYLQIGILCEDDEMVKKVSSYFTATGNGNGALRYLVLAAHQDPLGSGETICQAQESGRDQGHAEMALAVGSNLCQAAWALYQANPTVKSLDFWGASDNAFLKMAEYVALTNLRDGSDNANKTGAFIIETTKIPWTAVGPWCTGGDNHEASHVHSQFANDSGRGGVRPGWELIYQHYKAVGVNGYKYSKMFADKMRPECGVGDSRYGGNSGAFDQIGWGTLMMYQE